MRSVKLILKNTGLEEDCKSLGRKRWLSDNNAEWVSTTKQIIAEDKTERTRSDQDRTERTRSDQDRTEQIRSGQIKT